MGNRLNIIGNIYEYLTVIENAGSTKNKMHSLVKCLCQCGNNIIVPAAELTRGRRKSCGCKTIKGNFNTTHGHTVNHSSTPEFRTWMGMKMRCYNKNSVKYYLYGGRGVTVCERWINSFENFLSDMGNRPSAKHSLDRFPNKDGNYAPDNCRWATIGEQNRNKRNNVWINYNGSEIILKDFARMLNADPKGVKGMLQKNSVDEVAAHYSKKNNDNTTI